MAEFKTIISQEAVENIAVLLKNEQSKQIGLQILGVFLKIQLNSSYFDESFFLTVIEDLKTISPQYKEVIAQALQATLDEVEKERLLTALLERENIQEFIRGQPFVWYFIRHWPGADKFYTEIAELYKKKLSGQHVGSLAKLPLLNAFLSNLDNLLISPSLSIQRLFKLLAQIIEKKCKTYNDDVVFEGDKINFEHSLVAFFLLRFVNVIYADSSKNNSYGLPNDPASLGFMKEFIKAIQSLTSEKNDNSVWATDLGSMPKLDKVKHVANLAAKLKVIKGRNLADPQSADANLVYKRLLSDINGELKRLDQDGNLSDKLKEVEAQKKQYKDGKTTNTGRSAVTDKSFLEDGMGRVRGRSDSVSNKIRVRLSQMFDTLEVGLEKKADIFEALSEIKSEFLSLPLIAELNLAADYIIPAMPTAASRANIKSSSRTRATLAGTGASTVFSGAENLNPILSKFLVEARARHTSDNGAAGVVVPNERNEKQFQRASSSAIEPKKS